MYNFNMFLKLVLLCYYIALTSVNSAVLEETISSCSNNEFKCRDGRCISIDRICDDVPDCASADDEENCNTGSESFVPAEPVIHRSKRQASSCRRDQWQCRDGTCISFDGKCDGLVDCPDASDETHALCRKVPCQSNWFRCTYGACVDGTAPCNGIQECADNSDELLPRCRNETMEVDGNFRCDNGDVIIAANLCDGAKDCADGSDETLKSCASKKCLPYLFQCAYGACVDQGADCNNIKECADGSDEADDLCNRNTGPVIAVTGSPNGQCVLPPYPDHGSYVTNIPNAKPGQRFESYQINVTCNRGYGVVGDASVICLTGWSMAKIPECVPFCRLTKQPSVDYYCLLTGEVEGRRICNEYEPSNTQVIPECKKPNYYSLNYLRQMTCIDGSWSYVATCEAGLVQQGTNITIIVKGNVEIYINSMPFVEPTEAVKPSTESEISESDWRMGVPDSKNVTYDNSQNSLNNIAVQDNFIYGAVPSKTFKTNYVSNKTASVNLGTKGNNNTTNGLHPNSGGIVGFVPNNFIYSYNNSHVRKGVIPSRVFKTGSDRTYKSLVEREIKDSNENNMKSTWRYSLTSLSKNRSTFKGAMPSSVFNINLKGQNGKIHNVGSQFTQKDNSYYEYNSDDNNTEIVSSFKTYKDFDPISGAPKNRNTSRPQNSVFNNVKYNTNTFKTSFNQNVRTETPNTKANIHVDISNNRKNNQSKFSYGHTGNEIDGNESGKRGDSINLPKDSNKNTFGQSLVEKGNSNINYASHIYFPDQDRPGKKKTKVKPGTVHNTEIKIQNGYIDSNKNDDIFIIKANTADKIQINILMNNNIYLTQSGGEVQDGIDMRK